MRIFLATAFALCVFCLFSCHQEDSLEPPASRLENDSIYISKLAYVDTLAVAGLDTTKVFRFKYDDKKRLVTIFIDEYLINKPSAQHWEIYEYTYYGNESLPVKEYHRTGSYKSGSSGDPTTTFFWYTNGVVSRDSVIRMGLHPVNLVRKFTKLSSTTYKTVYSGYSSYSFADSVYSQITKVNGCITYQKDSIYNSGGNLNIEEKVASYDNNSNPFYRVAIPYPLLGSGINEKTAHNLKRLKQTLHPGQTQEVIREYQYRKDGYPVFSRSGILNESTKGIFIYTRL